MRHALADLHIAINNAHGKSSTPRISLVAESRVHDLPSSRL
jgi:hypothetical protein